MGLRNRTKSRKLIWKLFLEYLVFTLFSLDYVYAIRKGRLMIPNAFTALSGDLHVQLQLIESLIENLNGTLHLEISKLKRNNEKEQIDNVPLHPDPRNNVTQISIHCSRIYRGGDYEIKITTDNINEKLDERLTQQLDVRWPQPNITVNADFFGTYEQAVDFNLTFPEVNCDLEKFFMEFDRTIIVPEFKLELVFCGPDKICSNNNQNLYSQQKSNDLENSIENSNETSQVNILYSETIKGYPRRREVKLNCELFGLAGFYAIRLRALNGVPSYVSAIRYLRIDWNEKYVFNVHARSIFPCDPHTGVGVLFEYPTCILDQADRIRLYAKLRADVISLQPPTSLHYVTEQRVIKGQHSLYFDCEFFSEKYVEYCFVYVSQAISGAVADIRMDCVPTLPVSDLDSGGWGNWSEWTPCSTTCSSGTQNRYRLCDSPPPRYGAKFCEGSAVETKSCGKKIIDDTWDCLGIETTTSSNVSNEVISEIGPGCRCGCIVHLGISKPRRILAATAQSCPGRSFWLIQADDNRRIKFTMDFFRLLCSGQFIKIRDGDSLSSNLMSQYVGGSKIYPEPLISTGTQVLVEFVSDELELSTDECRGGFLAHVQTIDPNILNVTVISIRAIKQKPQPIVKTFTIVHLTAVIFASIIIIISALLGAQYVLRYRKYHLAMSKSDQDSPIHTPRASIGSLHHPPSRAISTSTLISDVIYLVKVRPKNKVKHKILRESIDIDAITVDARDKDDNNCDDTRSQDSSQTLTNISISNDKTNETTDKDIDSPSPKGCGSIGSKSQRSLNSISCESSNNGTDSTWSKDRSMEKARSEIIRRKFLQKYRKEIGISSSSDADSMENIQEKTRFLSASNATLTKGCYSPSSSIISTATIRSTNPKESKDKKNREKLLSRPDSEFSLGNPEELELDYYGMITM
ncbi:uncharacterized protein LOC129606828 isoform X2 [Condylostylus longicornis]|uniref:uncharacterized protein LOC129606828 isoform X2 n=1 Tax=Condylostylus longicornis TaxID=2530218 RepID=UPI00244E3070|nr:uncharacterized protein LOC129606828 isoform X2 [Condylostylus longicornis]